MEPKFQFSGKFEANETECLRSKLEKPDVSNQYEKMSVFTSDQSYLILDDEGLKMTKNIAKMKNVEISAVVGA